MNKLPSEILDHIYFYIPGKYLATLNKTNYDKYQR